MKHYKFSYHHPQSLGFTEVEYVSLVGNIENSKKMTFEAFAYKCFKNKRFGWQTKGYTFEGWLQIYETELFKIEEIAKSPKWQINQSILQTGGQN